MHVFSTVSLAGGFLFSFLFHQIFPQWVTLRFVCYAMSLCTGLSYSHNHLRKLRETTMPSKKNEFPIIWTIRLMHTTPWILLATLEWYGVREKILVVQGGVVVLGSIAAANSDGTYLTTVNNMAEMLLCQLNTKNRVRVTPVAEKVENAVKDTEANSVVDKEKIAQASPS